MTPGRDVTPSFEVALPSGVRAPRQARELVRTLLRGAEPSARSPSAHTEADALLIVNELVSNALAHGSPDADGTILVSGRLHDGYVVLSVLDTGASGTVEAVPFSGDAENGRGLSIVASLSAEWSVDRSVGTRVTARLLL